LILSGISFYYYGIRALIIVFISVSVCWLTDFICIIIRKSKYNIRDISSIITGLILALMMPASIPYRIVVIAAVFSIVIGKQAFGGHKCEIFNSAAVGFLFVSLCFADNVFMYPKPFDTLTAASTVTNELSETLSGTVIMSSVPNISFIDILLGKFCGPMGATHIMILLVAALFLILRRSVSAIVFFTETIVVLTFSFFYNNMQIDLLPYTLGGDMLLFGIMFLSCDYSTVPKTRSSRFIYGLIVGFMIILFQYFGKAGTAIVFAVILAAPFGIELDRKALSFAKMLNKNKGTLSSAKKIFNKPLHYINETITLLERDDKTDEKRTKTEKKNK
jgi:electron transport complex protein RnfD